MKLSEAWLREFMGLSLSHDELVIQLPLYGFEIDNVESTAPQFQHVVIGEVLSCERHPNADKLSVCQVNIGETEPLSIVCGAPNIGANMRVPVAIIGAVLPNDFKIKKAKLRGVTSQGMICSQAELGLGEDQGGIWQLPSDAPIGEALAEYLQLANDYILDIGLTPNRGDCLSAEGMAREIAAINAAEFQALSVPTVPITAQQVLNVELQAIADCPRYVGRVIENVDLSGASPMWLQERLRRSGLRTISLIVDIANYVMLELGQPLHAFDLAKIDERIIVRHAQENEPCGLLDGQTVSLQATDLVIADQSKVLALAGIMGGSESAVSESTTSIFLESAFFAPQLISGRARRYGLHTDASHRFERGVDPALCQRAIERATELIVQFAGGKACPMVTVEDQKQLPTPMPITLRQARATRLLGMALKTTEIEAILSRLQMRADASDQACWQVTAPSFRFDITQEVDVIEELIRLYGYDNLPSQLPDLRLTDARSDEPVISARRFADILIARDYHEVITYSFVNEAIQQLLFPDRQALTISNPISHDLRSMRTSLWPSLLSTAKYNLNRRHLRLRLFELGRSYCELDGELIETPLLSGLVTGDVYTSQWGQSPLAVDFYDVKRDVQAVLALNGIAAERIHFQATDLSCLHPGQAAAIYFDEHLVGYLGVLHPQVAKQLAIKQPVVLFELQLQCLQAQVLPHYQAISKFPAVQRDLSIVVDEAITGADVCQAIRRLAAKWLQDVVIFDVYRGSNIANGQKSFALGLTLQAQTRTLIDDEINALMDQLITELGTQFGASLRS